MTETILCMAAHSDDEVIGCGGTIRKYIEEGKRVIVIIFSAGDLSNPWLRKEYIIKERTKESEKIEGYLGTNEVIMLGIKDRTLEEEVKKIKLKNIVKGIIRKYKPSKIFVHSERDAHKDHKAVNKIVMGAVGSVDKNKEISVFAYEVWNVRNEESPRMYVDVSKTFKKKIEAMKKFRTQLNYIYPLMISVMIRSRVLGLIIGVKYAERFYKIR